MTTLALIGVGPWGVNYLKTVKKFKDCQIKYIVAQNQDALSNMPDEYIKTSNYKDLFKHLDIDGVIIATPGASHYGIAKEFLRKNFFILVEKPMTTSYGDALSMKELTGGKKSKVFVGHIYLYNPAYQVVKKLLPEIGEIRYISFKGWNFGTFRNDMSALWEWAPHGISICLDLLNDIPEEVWSWGIEALRPGMNLYDNVCVRLRFRNNINAFLECGWLYPVKKRELIVCGSTSTIIFDDLADKKVTFLKNLGPKVIDKKIISQNLETIFPSFDATPSLQVEVQEFINFIRSGKQPKSDLDQAVKIAGIIDASEKSLVNKSRPVLLDTWKP